MDEIDLNTLIKYIAPRIDFDKISDVLYVNERNAKIYNSIESHNDSNLILNMDLEGNIVGLQLLCASEISTIDWQTHPDRNIIPEKILREVDIWFKNGKMK